MHFNYINKDKEFFYRNLNVFLCIFIVIFLDIFYPDWFYYKAYFNFSVFEFDQYGYAGITLDPIVQRLGYKDIFLTELLPVYWPQHVFISLFNPILGKFLFKNTALLLILLFTSQSAKMLFGMAYGIIAPFVILTNAFFLPRISSDYTTGHVILFLSAAIYLIISNSKSEKTWKSLALGVALACMVCSALLTLVYFPSLAIIHFLLKRKNQGVYFGWEDLKVIAGILLSLAVIEITDYAVTGEFFYMKYNIMRIFEFTGMDRTNGWNNYFSMPWLQPFFFVITLVFIEVVITLNKPINRITLDAAKISNSAIVITSATVAFVILAYLQIVKKQGTIGDTFYFNQLLPLISLSVVSIFNRYYSPIDHKIIWCIPLACLASIVLSIYCIGDVQTYRLGFFLCTVALFILLKTFYVSNKSILKSISLIFSLILFLLFQSYSCDLWSSKGWLSKNKVLISDPVTNSSLEFSLGKDIYLSVIEWMKLMDKINRDRKYLFWYNVNEPHGILFRFYNLAAFLWQERLINEQFPLTNVPDNDWHGPKHIHINPGQTIIIATNFRDAKLNELAKILSSDSLSYDIVDESLFKSGPIVFNVLKVKILPSMKNHM